MFSRLATYAILALPLFAVATPTALEARGGQPASQCNTGDLQCCNSVESASSPAGAALLGLLGIVVTDPNVLLGLNCSPITVVGVGSGSGCSANPVCCTDNSHGNVVSVGCVPVVLNL